MSLLLTLVAVVNLNQTMELVLVALKNVTTVSHLLFVHLVQVDTTSMELTVLNLYLNSKLLTLRLNLQANEEIQLT